MNPEVQTKILDFDRICVYTVGGIVENNDSTGVIRHCEVMLTCSSTDVSSSYTGPIAGENVGTVFNCNNEYFYINTGNLHSWWAWFITYDRLKNINNTI